MVGDAFTVRVAILLGEPADGVCVVVTPDVALGFPPTVLLVTLKVTVQLLLAGIVIPVKLIFFNDTPTAEIYALSLHDALPISTALMLDSVSVNAAPVRSK